jgi:hypothetical protein
MPPVARGPGALATIKPPWEIGIMNRSIGWTLASLLAISVPASAQVVFVVPAWQPIPTRVILAPVAGNPTRVVAPASAAVIPAPPIVAQIKPVPTTIERYYFMPGTSPATVPPANSTGEAPAPSAWNEPITTAGPRVIIREYFLPADPVDGSIRQIPIPTLMPRKLAIPPWSDEYEKKPPANDNKQI